MTQIVRRDAHTRQSISKIKTKAMLQVRRIAFVFISVFPSIRSIKSTLLRKVVTALAITTLCVPGSVLFIGLNNKAIAAESSYINFQARILQASGALVPDGTYHVQFKLYDAVTSGTLLWTETRDTTTTAVAERVIVKNGYVSARLGAVTSFTSINWNEQLYLTINIGGTGASPAWDGEMSPRFALTSVPYAKVAKDLKSSATASTSTNSDGISISTGNATGLTSNSGNITIDTGTATSTAGTISIAGTNASSLTLARSGLQTTIAGNALIQGGTLTVGTTSQAGSLVISDGSSNTVTLTSSGVTANYSLILPTASGTTDQCLKTSSSSASQLVFGSCGTTGAVISIGTLDSQTKSANGAVIASSTLYMQTADSTNVGLVSIGTQSFAGAKTFTGAVTVNGAASVTSGNLSIGADSVTNGTITLYSSGAVADPTISANASGDLTVQSLAGTTVVGDGSGGIQMQLSSAADVLTGTKTFTAASAYSSDDFSFTRTVTGGANNLTGNVFKIVDNSTTSSGTFTPTLLYLNQTNTSAAGYLINAAQNGTSKFSVTPGGNTSIAGTLGVTGLTTLNGGLTVEIGDTFTFNGDAFTDLTGSGLTVSANALTVDTTSATGFFRNGGNSFGATATLGTNDAFGLSVETNNTVRASFADGNILYLGNADSATGLAASPNAFTIQGTSNSTAAGAGAAVSVLAGDGNTSGAGGLLTLRGGVAGATATGGGVTIGAGNGGATSGSGGAISITGGSAAGSSGNGGAVNISTGSSNGVATSGSINLSVGQGLTQGSINLSTLQFNGLYGNFNIGAAGGRTQLGTATTNAKLSVVNVGATYNADSVILGQSSATQTGNLLTLRNSALTNLFVVDINGNATIGGTLAVTSTITGTTLNGTTGINTGASAGTQRIDASGNLVNIGTITSGLINGQTISSSANFTGTLAVTNAITGSSTITGTTLNGTTGINTGASGGTQRITSTGNLVNIGTITSGLINSQTISSAANFTGTLAVTGAITAPTTVNTINGLIINAGTLSAATTVNTINGLIINAGALSGATTLGLSGAITGATATNTINGLIINAGALTSGLINGQTISTSANLTGTLAVAGNVTVGSGAGVGIFTNNGATVNTTLAVANLAGGGPIGTAAATVNIYTTASIAQTTASQTVTIPAPTASTTYGRMFMLSNIGTVSFTLLGITVNPGNTASLIWQNTNGAASWQFYGGGGISNGITSVGAISGTSTANGVSVTGATLNLTAADGTNGGVVTNTTQTFAGAKTFSSAITAPTTANTINGLIINAGAITGATTLGLSGAITGATTANTINSLIISAGALSGITGYTQTSGNFAMSGTGTFGTGTGAISLNGNTTIASGSTLTVAGTGATSLGGTLGVTGVATLSASGNALIVTNSVSIGATLTLGGNFAMSGTGTFGTGTGAISLNGATSVTGTNTFTVGTGATSLGGTLAVTGTINSQTISTTAQFTGTLAVNNAITGSSTITGTTLNGTTGINTGASGGTQRITSTGNLVGIGTITSGLINGQTISSSANFTGNLAVTTSVAAPIYYDSSGTTYYLDLASTSNLNTLNVAGDLTVGPKAGNNAWMRISAPAGYYAIQYFMIGSSHKWHYESAPNNTFSFVESNVAARLTFNPGGAVALNGSLSATGSGNQNNYIKLGNIANDSSSFLGYTQYGNLRTSSGYGVGIGWISTGNVDFNGYVPNVHALFLAGTTPSGDIRSNSPSTTSYNTTSDYRLKTNIVDLQDQDTMARIRQLRPKQYNFTTDINGTRIDGFLAHEVQGIVPIAVSGTTDAINANGDPIYQMMDMTWIMPLAIKGVQVLDTQVQSMNTRLAVIEAGNLLELHVTGDAEIGGSLTVTGDTFVQNITINGKIITAGNAPAIALGSNSIVGQNAQITVEGNDTAGTLTYSTGQPSLPNYDLKKGEQAQIVFATASSTKPRVMITAKNSLSASVRYYIESSLTGFKLHFLDNPEINQNYEFDYFVVQ